MAPLGASHEGPRQGASKTAGRPGSSAEPRTLTRAGVGGSSRWRAARGPGAERPHAGAGAAYLQLSAMALFALAIPLVMPAALAAATICLASAQRPAAAALAAEAEACRPAAALH